MITLLNSHMEIAETILNQMGGANKLYTMIGAQHIVALDGTGGLQFSFKGCNKTNKIVIMLNGLDLYDVTFFKLNKSKATCGTVSGFQNIYAEDLVDLFADQTGLYLSL